MRKKICSILLLIAFTLALSYSSSARYLYRDLNTSYIIIEEDDQYRVDCSVEGDIGGSAKLQRLKSRLRLKSIDLIGNYIILNSLDLPFTDRGDLLQAFVDNTSLHFTANIEHIKSGTWNICKESRCISFYCSKDDFVINSAYLEQEFNISEILVKDFRKNRSISSACRYIDMFELDQEELIEIELLFLSGNAFIATPVAKLLDINPANRLESSLYMNDSLQILLADSVSTMKFEQCAFEEMIVSRILFTSSAAKNKQKYFSEYTSNLSKLDGQWYSLLRFAADHSVPLDTSELSVFDIIGSYPMAANPYGLRAGDNSSYYDEAVKAFANEDPTSAIEMLRNQISFSGINSYNLNLTGASYRLLKEYDKALGFLLMAYYIDEETPYVKGNLIMCLQKLNYPDLDLLANYFLEQNIIDPWSKNQIETLNKE